MKVAWPTATCNLKRIIGPCHQYGHESLRAKHFYRAIKLYNCFRSFLSYIGQKKYFFRGYYILIYLLNQVLGPAWILCDLDYAVNQFDHLLDVCTSPLFNWQRDTLDKRTKKSIFLRRMYTLYDLCNLADAGTESMHQVWNSNLSTCQVQNFTSVHVPDDVKFITSLSKIVTVRGFFASLLSCSIPASCEKQLCSLQKTPDRSHPVIYIPG